MKLPTFSSSPLLSKGFGFLSALRETVFGISFLSIFRQHFNHFLAFYPTIGTIRVFNLNHKSQGVTLTSTSDIDISTLEQEFAAARIGCSLKILSQIDSTNEEIKRNLAENLPEGAVVIAGLQTHGKGRQGRSWHSEPGSGLYLSVLLKPSFPTENLACITLMAGVAAASTLKHYAPVKLKWPNDILLNGKKLAGILCECVPGATPAVIVGIGINLNHTHFPKEIQGKATSLKLETGITLDRTNLILNLLKSLDTEYEAILQGKIENLICKWTDQSDMFGQTVTVYQKGKNLVGKALGLNSQGKLILQTPEGEQRLLDSGEVSFNPI